MNLDPKEIKDIREKVLIIRKEMEKFIDKEFVYGEMQTLIGVFKVKNGLQNRK